MTTRVLLQQIFNYLKNEYDVSDWWRDESALEICVGAILVQNTTWRQAHVALKQLITTGNLEINEIKNLDILILQKLIKQKKELFNSAIKKWKNNWLPPYRDC